MTRKRCHNDKLFTSKTTQGVSFLTCLPSHCREGQRCHLAHPTPALCQISGTEGVLNIQEMNFFFKKTKHSFASSSAPRLTSASHSIYSPHPI